jgi:hypothetical protein
MRGGATFRNVRQPFVPSSSVALSCRALVFLPDDTLPPARCVTAATRLFAHALPFFALLGSNDLAYTLARKLRSLWLPVQHPPTVRARVMTMLNIDLSSVQGGCFFGVSCRCIMLNPPQPRLVSAAGGVEADAADTAHRHRCLAS